MEHPIENVPEARRVTFVILLCFFTSGAAALIYEVLWFRHLSLVFGVTSYALSTILIAFMAGLGLGSFAVGRWGSRVSRPLRLYALAELAIGIYAACSPWIIGSIQPLYTQLYRSAGGPFPFQPAFFFALTFAALILPTFLMGATLPLLVLEASRHSKKIVQTIGGLYFANTLGGVAGAAAAGYWLILWLGMTGTLWTGVLLNFLAAAGALALDGWWGKGRIPETPVEAAPAPVSGRPAMIPLAVIFLSGAASMIYQVGWTRLVSLLVGSSTYAFTTILVAFLLGLALGGVCFGMVSERSRHPMLLLAIIQAGVACFVWLSSPLMDRAHLVIFEAYLLWGDQFWGFQAAEFLVVILVAFIPTFLLGATFPVAIRVDLDQRRQTSRSVGDLYASNTLGTILGAGGTGFFLLAHPAIGVQKSLMIGAAANLVAAGLALGAVCKRRPSLVAAIWVVGAAGAGAAFAWLPRWNQRLLTCGVYDRPAYLKHELRRQNINALRESRPLNSSGLNALLQQVEREKLLLYAEGPDATVTVTELPVNGEEPRKFLRINGKCEATSAFGHDLSSQVLVSQVGMCLHPSPGQVAIIGLGSGVSLGSILTHPEVARVDCLELSPSVVRGARIFGKENLGALDDPRLRLLLNDGRNHMLASDRSYDVIISEPTNPWVSGVSNLFTREHYQHCRERLAPGGLMCQWFHAYSMTPDLVRMIVRTFLEVFPHATLWINRTDVFLVGSPSPWAFDPRTIASHMREPGVQSDFARIQIRSVDDFLRLHVLNTEEIHSYCGSAGLNTDSHPVLEFQAPWCLYTMRETEIMEAMRSFRKPVPPAPPAPGNVGLDREKSAKTVPSKPSPSPKRKKKSRAS